MKHNLTHHYILFLAVFRLQQQSWMAAKETIYSCKAWNISQVALYQKLCQSWLRVKAKFLQYLASYVIWPTPFLWLPATTEQTPYLFCSSHMGLSLLFHKICHVMSLARAFAHTNMLGLCNSCVLLVLAQMSWPL